MNPFFIITKLAILVTFIVMAIIDSRKKEED